MATDIPTAAATGDESHVIDGWMAVLLLFLAFSGGMAAMWAILDGDARFVYEAWRRASRAEPAVRDELESPRSREKA